MIYMYEAVKRPKENTDMSGIKFVREVQYPDQTEGEVIERLSLKIARLPGVWRIYRSVNKRDEVKSKLELIETLTRQLVLPSSVSNKNPESLWKDILMQPHNKAERLFLLDVDTREETVIAAILNDPRIQVKTLADTPNGFHVICEPFDPRIIEKLAEVSVKKDALLYIKTITVPMIDRR